MIDAKQVALVVYDFDGVMTDNRARVDENGIESVVVNRSDGLGVRMIRDLGIPQMILSTETNQVVETRAKKLKLPVAYGCEDKKAYLLRHCEAEGIDPVRVLYVGNDTNDVEIMQVIGIPVAPADAHPAILEIATYVMTSIGGGGVVKELAEHLAGVHRGA